MGTVHAREQLSSFDMASFDSILAKVVKIHVKGLSTTKNDIVVDSVRHVFKAKDFNELIQSAVDGQHRLESLKCFKKVNVEIDTAADFDDNSYVVSYSVEEMGPLKGSVNGMVGHREGAGVMAGLYSPNLFGRGETLSANYSYGYSRSNDTYSVKLQKPLRYGLADSISSSLFQLRQPQSIYAQTDRGAVVDIDLASWWGLVHNVALEVTWRELTCLDREAILDIRKKMGHFLKTSIKNSLTYDGRDEPMWPTRGNFFRLRTELAGGGGDASFFRNEIESQFNVPLRLWDMGLQFAFNAGFLRSSQDNIGLSDLFYLGGPSSVRGFVQRGIQADELGGRYFWAGALHLYTPMPFHHVSWLNDYLRTHTWINGGDLWNTKDWGRGLWGCRISSGLGLVLRVGGLARLEMNYCIPLQLDGCDRWIGDHGLQFGIGIDFL